MVENAWQIREIRKSRQVEKYSDIGSGCIPLLIDSFISAISKLLSEGEVEGISACLSLYEGLDIPAKKAKVLFPFVENFIAEVVQRGVADEASVALVLSLLARTGYKSSKQVLALTKLLAAVGRESAAADLLICMLSMAPDALQYFGALLLLPDGEAKHRAIDLHFERLRAHSTDNSAISACYAFQLLLVDRQGEVLEMTRDASLTAAPALAYARVFAFYYGDLWDDANALLKSIRYPEGGAGESLAKLLSFFAKHKPIVQLARKMIALGKESLAANLLDYMSKVFPLAPGYFNTILLLQNLQLRDSLVSSHFERLKILGNVNPGALALHAIQLVQLQEYRQAAALVEGKDVLHPDLFYARALALFWSDRFREASDVLDKKFFSEFSPKRKMELASLNIRTALVLGNEEKIGPLLSDCLKVDLIYANLAIGDYESAFRRYFDSDVIPFLRKLGDNVLDDSCVAQVRAKQFRTCAIVCSMGVGDEVRFASMLPEVRLLFEKTVLYCDPRLVEIMARSFPEIEVRACDFRMILSVLKTSSQNEMVSSFRRELSQYDLLCDLKQFSWLLRSSPDLFPHSGSCLRPHPERHEKWRAFLGGFNKPVIGLFWGSRILTYTASHKQSNLQDWVSFLPDDIFVIPLQYEITKEEAGLISGDHRFIKGGALDFDLKNDLEETFALLAALPLVISTAGTTQHMAGAVGTHVLCPTHPFQARWRKLYGYHHDVWSPNVDIITGHPEDGMTGAVRLCVDRFSSWLVDENVNF